MTRKYSRRISSRLLQADRNAFISLQALADYRPANADFSKDAVQAKLQTMEVAHEAEIKAQNAMEAARDAVAMAEWDFHDAILGVKDQVIAQYGDSSDQVQSLGLKKKTEYRSTAPRHG
jgi:hypothetical protein